jgi:hypothetical protein
VEPSPYSTTEHALAEQPEQGSEVSLLLSPRVSTVLSVVSLPWAFLAISFHHELHEGWKAAGLSEFLAQAVVATLTVGPLGLFALQTGLRALFGLPGQERPRQEPDSLAP